MGMIQKSLGDLFETVFQNACLATPGMAVTRFPDGCRVIGANKVVRTKTPCDWVLTYGAVTALIDTKTTEGDSFPHSKICEHQINEMVRHEQAGAKAGYVIWFRKSDHLFFLSALYLSGLINTRGSVKMDEISCSFYIGKCRQFRPKLIFGMN